MLSWYPYDHLDAIYGPKYHIHEMRAKHANVLFHAVSYGYTYTRIWPLTYAHMHIMHVCAHHGMLWYLHSYPGWVYWCSPRNQTSSGWTM